MCHKTSALGRSTHGQRPELEHHRIASAARSQRPQQRERRTGRRQVPQRQATAGRRARNADGELEGFEIDLGNELCQRAQLDCEWVVQGWDGIIPGLLSRKYDAILSSMRITPAREQQVRFTEPYAMSPKVWVARAGHAISLDDPQSLAGLSVGIQRGTTQDNYVTERYSDTLDIRRYDTAADVALDLEAERIDLAFINYPVALETLNIGASDAQFVQVGPRINSPESIFGRGNAIAVRPRDEALAESFNQALDSVYADGTFVELMERYFDYDLRPASRL